MEARLRRTLDRRADFSEVLTGSWTALAQAELASRPVYLDGEGPVTLGDLFELRGERNGRLEFQGDLGQADRIGAGLAEGSVLVDGDVGDEIGVGMSGGTLEIRGSAGVRAGAALPGAKRGMIGGELVITGSAGAEAAASMRRGVVAIGRDAGPRSGLGMIAGSLIVGGRAGADTGLWSKRGSVVALGEITPPQTYAYACTYRPVHLRLLLTQLKERYKISIQRRHITGRYRRYSGDFAELGKGEILQWVLQS